jgi:hypothetical protein
VLARVKDLRRRKSKCNLYSVGPSCGSASSLVMLVYSAVDDKEPILVVSFTAIASPVGSGLVCWRGFGDPEGPPFGGAVHGDDTRGGSGSKVNIEAITLLY